MYLSFLNYMKLNKRRINEFLFKEDIMYKGKIWKANKQSYKAFCKAKGLSSDYNMIDDEVCAYEKRILDFNSNYLKKI